MSLFRGCVSGAAARSDRLRGRALARGLLGTRRPILSVAHRGRGGVRMIDLKELRPALADARVDGWLLFDFHGLNPVAGRVLGLTGMNTRRLFVLLPRDGEAVAVAHKIELQGLEGFPGRVVPYARWSELHAALATLVSGRRLAMEISPEDAVPYLDRVPYGVVELLRKLGATVVP